VLSLALVGMFGYVGSAMAACPTGPTTAEGGAWTAKSVSPGSSVAIATPGLDGSECKLDAAIAGSLTGTATVSYTHAASEPSYRFQFLVNPDALGSFSLTDSVGVFRANASTPANGSSNALQVNLVAGSGGTRRVRFNAACNVPASSFRCTAATSTNLPAGVARIEGKLTFGAGAAGKLDVWVNAAAGSTEPATTLSISNLDNAAWAGVGQATLGLANPSVPYKNAHANQVVGFDRFDSRRQTYIGW
ncbi:MAG: hypothetical protein DCC58_20220, partial [Chloroflexi bacterium]